MSHNTVIMIQATLSSVEEAENLGENLVMRCYAASVSVSPAITNVFLREGQVQREEHASLMIKTSRNRVDEIMLEIHRLNPNQAPDIVMWEAIAHPSFAAQVDEYTKEF